jgi:hypothetical protein
MALASENDFIGRQLGLVRRKAVNSQAVVAAIVGLESTGTWSGFKASLLGNVFSLSYWFYLQPIRVPRRPARED